MMRTGLAGLAGVVLLTASAARAEEPRLVELRTQNVGGRTYFQAKFTKPKDLRVWPRHQANWWWNPAQIQRLARQPRLVPQDTTTRNVYAQADPREPDPDQLEFVGVWQGGGAAKFNLVYPVAADKEKQVEKGLVTLPGVGESVVVPITLDFDKSRRVEVPAEARRRANNRQPDGDDLEGLWAAAQATQFAILEAQTNEFGFYSFAREATGRKYNVPARALNASRSNPNGDLMRRRLYETMTGSAAITESLAMQRMRTREFRADNDRTIDIAKVPGITIAEHPWKKMMGDRKPAEEPLAKMIPHDNYYVRFKSIAKFIEFGGLVDLWGTNLTRAYEVNSRDAGVQKRYERQLCLKSGWVGKTLGPAVVKGVAITGNDLYVREGSDVTIIFQVKSKKLFLAGVEGFLKEARREHGGRLAEGKEKYRQIDIETFVTPEREVSLNRASFDEYVVYSNSPIALRRVIDSYQGRDKALADSLDFQYMRTIFRADDEKEDGFAFLSDAFIRKMVGPASKIKEKRRLEALTSLRMETNGALFHAWETGKMPEDHKLLLASSTLKLEEIFLPDGQDLKWDAQRNQAYSSTYNTINFATPLIELPIDRVTPQEDRDYREFRARYLGLWRQYFDPIGIRVGLRDKQVKIDTYILPLIKSSQYNQLRELTGDGVAELNLATIAPETLFQYTMHLSPKAPQRGWFARDLQVLGVNGLGWLGNWGYVRVDDDPVFDKLGQHYLREQIDPEYRTNWQQQAALFFQIPVSVGVEIKNRLTFAATLGALRNAVLNAAPDSIEWGPMKEKHRGVSIVRIKGKGDLARELGGVEPAIYYATIGNGFHASLREEALKRIIDRHVDLREGKLPKGEKVELNSSVYVAPGAVKKAQNFLRGYLELECQRRALANEPIWHCLYATDVINAKMDAQERAAIASRYFGFVPVSPEGAAYSYDAKLGEIVNARHGSLRAPKLHTGIDESAPLAQVLAQFRSIRGDLRFREDGIHTVLTIERK